jgi:hypothetical protein
MNARRYPRTMEAAFGPYHRSSQCPIEPMGGKAQRTADTVLYVVGVLGVIAAICFNNFN